MKVHEGTPTGTTLRLQGAGTLIDPAFFGKSTALLKAFKVPDGTDHTVHADYFTDVD